MYLLRIEVRMGVLIVAPQAFSRFTQHPSLLPYDKLLELLEQHESSDGPLTGRRLIAGQGLDERQMHHAWHLGTTRGLNYEFEHWHMARQKAAANKALCHKHRPENILISIPERQLDGAFMADLMLHERNELMLDHLTGQHIQGMVLAEACRQMFLAVTERYCLEGYPSPKRYFVIDQMNLRYLAFAFPLPAQIHYRVLDRQQPKPARVSIHANMDVLQGSQVVAGMDVKFTVFDDAYISAKEEKLAADAVNQYVSHLRDTLAPDIKAPLHLLSSQPIPAELLETSQ